MSVFTVMPVINTDCDISLNWKSLGTMCSCGVRKCYTIQKSMVVVPLYARVAYGLCLLSHTVLISFGYSQRLFFLTKYVFWLATCDRWVLVPICCMQDCRKIYPCSSHQTAKMSAVTSQPKDPQKYEIKVLGIIPGRCRHVWEAVCRVRSVSQCRVWCVRNTAQHCCGLSTALSSHGVMHLAPRPADHKTEWHCHSVLTVIGCWLLLCHLLKE